MKCALYTSLAEVDFSESKVNELAYLASEKNRQLGITGYLCFNQNKFFQYVEGPVSAIDKLVKNLRSDKRHSIEILIESEEVQDRIFAAWSMRYVKNEELPNSHMEDYLARNMLYIQQNAGQRQHCLDNIWNQLQKISTVLDSYAKLKNIPTYPVIH